MTTMLLDQTDQDASSAPLHTKTVIFGCEVEFATIGDSLVPHTAVEDRLHTLDRQFSRFSPSSEISHFNAAAGTWVEISREMHELLREALTAAIESQGLVNIAILVPLIAAGYDRHWPFVQEASLRPPTEAGSPLAPLTEILELQQHRARLMPGHGLDFGAIAKGIWADDVVAMLGPNSICSLGGDIACRGQGPVGDGWPILLPEGEIAHVVNGGVATSGTTKRRWNGGHHIIDPRTGHPSESNITQVTVIADRCTTAEWVATSIVVGGDSTAEVLKNDPRVSAVFTES